MLGIGDSFKEAVGGTKNGKGKFGTVNQRGEAHVVAFSGLAEEYGLDLTAGTESFFDQADAVDTDIAVTRGKSAAQGHAKELEPAIVAAGDGSRFAVNSCRARGFFGRSHHRGG